MVFLLYINVLIFLCNFFVFTHCFTCILLFYITCGDSDPMIATVVVSCPGILEHMFFVVSVLNKLN